MKHQRRTLAIRGTQGTTLAIRSSEIVLLGDIRPFGRDAELGGVTARWMHKAAETTNGILNKDMSSVTV